MNARFKDIMRSMGNEWIISFVTHENPVSMYHRLKDRPLTLDIRKESQPRSKDANSFCWAMCTDIGKAIQPPIPKEEVYRKAIRDVGEYEPLPIKAEAVETFQRRWATKGIGWFADVIDDSKLPGYKLVFAYYGSSTYNTESMSKLIDYLKDEMQNLEIPIPISKAEEERLLQRWGKA